ncbi:MAG: FAD-dependent oxidoreductase [Rhodospirillales bacterium]|nr:FAD-dependent oxidoreductase [Rhodospirillales bacterium]MBT4625212.1 FAD-dependent oxidoreductase [Rhodospirillales bacterium]MBT5520937.1 FAD-dependent oxidoreductase [Rhodospirillales bacterium]MBT7146689.1 FAD-dependent oxidoreductase [Rhodospirillales bacterium]MBT7506727.1 FAD-dependent oxidoreductase [Rhodospirillales bacterium]
MAERHHSEIIIIGGGIIGCAIAYHLTRMGKTDVTLLEKSGLTHGATWHAAGLVGQLRSQRNTTRMLQKSVEVYDRLEEETGQSIDWKKVGSLRLASSPERVLEIKRSATMARSFGLEMEIISPTEARDLFPLMSTDGVLAAAYLPTDGQIDPASVTQALAKGARNGGATIKEGVRVTNIRKVGNRASELETEDGDIWTFDTVVNATGMWSRELGLKTGVAIPSCAVEHQYLITDNIPDMPQGMPTLRDPDRLVYYKADVNGLVVGGYENNTVPFGENGIPHAFGQELLENKFDRFEPLAELAGQVTPIINEVGVREMINGAIPYSADGDFVMGRARELDNYFVASGFLYGIAAGGGAGQMMAEWIIDGSPSLDLWPLDVRRFQSHHNTKTFMYARAVEHYGGHYLLHFPGEEKHTARGIRKSPLFGKLAHKGAVYGSKAGWERPNWFAPKGETREDRLSFDQRECNWFTAVGEECKAVRERVALIDQSSFAKMEVSGPGALEALNYLAAANVDKPVGSAIYTQLCNEKGGIEADLTINRLDDDLFYVVTGSGFGVRDFHWINTHLPSDGSVQTKEVTSAWSTLNVCGPKSRDVLAAVTDDDVSNETFPFSTCRQITIGSAPVRAIRIGYVGELGWELHIPTEFTGHVYDLLWQAGEDHGIADVGYRAIDSLRLEKNYLYWSSDISPDYNPFEAGLGFRVAFKTKGDYLGRAALEAIRQDGADRKLCTFVVEAPGTLYGGETIIYDGDAVGLLTSANYAHYTGQEIAYGYLPLSLAGDTSFDVEVFGERVAARRVDGPLYDPDNKRLTA